MAVRKSLSGNDFVESAPKKLVRVWESIQSMPRLLVMERRKDIVVKDGNI